MILLMQLQRNTMIKNKYTYYIIQLLGIASASIGALTVCGYIVGKPTLYTWSGNASMAISTAIAFILQGVALYIIGEKLKK